MDREDKYVFGGLGTFAIWFLVILPFSYQLPVSEKYSDQKTPAAAQYADRPNRQSNSTIAAPTKPLADQLPAERQSSQADKDGSEFWSAKLTDWLLAFFTLALVFFTRQLYIATADLKEATVGLLNFAGEQSRDMKASIRVAEDAARAAQSQAIIAERALTAAERAWISVDVVISNDLTIDSQGNVRVPLTFFLSNVGRSPATKAQIHSKLLIRTPTTDEVAEYTRYCSEMIEYKGEPLSYVLFPGEQPRKIGVIQTLGYPEVEQAKQAWKAHIKGAADITHFTISLIGCITYNMPLDSKRHHTGFMLWLGQRTAAIGLGGINVKETRVEAGSLVLYHSPLAAPTID